MALIVTGTDASFYNTRSSLMCEIIVTTFKQYVLTLTFLAQRTAGKRECETAIRQIRTIEHECRRKNG
jgi:hypothetical protein